jgi:hypothetical protein
VPALLGVGGSGLGAVSVSGETGRRVVENVADGAEVVEAALGERVSEVLAG